MLGEIDTGDPKVVKTNTDSSRPISSSTQAFYHRGDSDIYNNNINNCCNNEFLFSGPSGRGRDHCTRKLCKKKLFTENTSMDYYFIDDDNESINSAESRVNCETHLYNNYSDNHDKDVKKSVLNSSRVSNSFAESPVESSQRFRKLGDSKGRGSIDSEKQSRVENEWFVSYKSDECNLENNICINNYSFNNNINISNSNSSDNDSSSFRSSGRSGKSYKLKDKCDRRIPCRRFYLQFAFLLFLIAFGGQTGVGAGIGIGVPRSSVLGIITVGTMFGVSGVKAAPVDLGDAGIRAERSANLSHLTGTSRKILMFIKNKYLQILPDGTVNGTENFTADYNIFQRISVSSGQLKIQGVATCLYLCMDSCGLLYGSREYTEDCVFNETLEAHNYNTYSSIRWSTPRKTLYVGLNRHGQPRRVQARGHNLGRLSSYARVMTVVVSPDRVENLQARMMGVQHKVRHHHVTHHQTQHHHHQQQHHQNLQQSVCPSFPSQEKDGRDRFRCRKRRKRKKRKRRCEKNDKVDSNCETNINIKEDRPCPDTEDNINGSDDSSGKRSSCNYSTSADELSRRQLLNTSLVIKRKSRIDVINNKNDDRNNNNNNNNNNSNHNNHTSKKKEGKNNKKLMRKVGFVDGTGTTAATDVQHQQEQPHQEEQQLKGLVFKENSSLVKKKFPGRSIRTTVPAPSSENSNATLASWFTGATSTTQSSWEIFMKRSSSSPSPPTSRAIKLIDNPKRIPGDKDAQVSDPDVKGNATETSNVDDTSLSALETENLLTDGSSESEDDTLEEDSAYAGDYGVLMTTMDTTPPERTEDYAKTTTQSILESIEASRPLIDYLNRSVIDSSFPFRRLAM